MQKMLNAKLNECKCMQKAKEHKGKFKKKQRIQMLILERWGLKCKGFEEDWGLQAGVLKIGGDRGQFCKG